MKLVQLTPRQEDKATRIKFDAQTGSNANGFLAAVMLSLPHRYTRDIPTACVNTQAMYFNPDFMFENEEMPPDQQLFAAFHETLHLVYEHTTLRGTRNPQVWQHAIDYRVNSDLAAMGFNIQKQFIHDHEGDQFKDMTTFEIYEKLFDDYGGEVPELPNLLDGDIIEDESHEGQGDTKPDGTPLPVMKPEDAAGNIKEIIKSAAFVAHKQPNGFGSLPGHLVDMISSKDSFQVSWTEYMARIPQQIKRSGRNYKKFARRHISRGLYIPRTESKQVGTLGVAWDTSASVSDGQIALMKGELLSLRNALQPKKFKLVCFDTQIASVHELGPMDSIEDLPIQGRGGTNLEPVFEHFRSDTDVTALLVFSDMECHPIPAEQKPRFPVFWIIMDNPNLKPEFGTPIHFDSYKD